MDMQSFTVALSEMLVEELRSWQRRLAFETLRAFHLGCYPWHGYLELSFLTTQELFDETQYGKWSVGDWRWYHFTQTWDAGWPRAAALTAWMEQQYNEATDPPAIAEAFFVACAQAVTSERVMSELQQYRLTPDFEVAVFDPDTPEPRQNYCAK